MNIGSKTKLIKIATQSTRLHVNLIQILQVYEKEIVVYAPTIQQKDPQKIYVFPRS